MTGMATRQQEIEFDEFGDASHQTLLMVMRLIGQFRIAEPSHAEAVADLAHASAP